MTTFYVWREKTGVLSREKGDGFPHTNGSITNINGSHHLKLPIDGIIKPINYYAEWTDFDRNPTIVILALPEFRKELLESTKPRLLNAAKVAPSFTEINNKLGKAT